MKVVLLILLSIATFSQAADHITCQNQQGEAVDWWVMFKLPKDYNQGKQYIYFDSTPEGQTHRIYDDINNNSPFFNTIEQIREVTYTDRFALFWNDQLPNGKKNASSSYAHAKGAAGGNKYGGFIVNHSLPRTYHFDDDGNVALHVAESQLIYGQHLFCVSLDAVNLNDYAHSLIIDRVYIVDNGYIPESLTQTYSQFVLLQDNKYKFSDIPYHIQELTSISGKSFTKFAKHQKWENDIYREVVAKYFNSGLIFETWGRSLQDVDCDTQYEIKSSLTVQYTKDIGYSYTKDHSKFGITTEGNYVCFGDINRMYSQYHRGGGTTCFENEGIHNFIKNAFVEVQECPQKLQESSNLRPASNEQQEEVCIFGRFFRYFKSIFNY